MTDKRTKRQVFCDISTQGLHQSAIFLDEVGNSMWIESWFSEQARQRRTLLHSGATVLKFVARLVGKGGSRG